MVRLYSSHCTIAALAVSLMALTGCPFAVTDPFEDFGLQFGSALRGGTGDNSTGAGSNCSTSGAGTGLTNPAEPTITAISPNTDYDVKVPPSGEAWMGLSAQAGDELIIDAVPQSSEDEFHVALYSPAGWMIEESDAPAGYPQNVRSEVGYSGQARICVTNLSSNRQANPHIMVQHIRASSTSQLNGVYNITMVDGHTPGAVEKWVFDNGKLVSRYVSADLSAMGGTGVFEQWYEHRVGRVGKIFEGGSVFTYSTSQNTTTVNGSSITMSYTVSAQWSGGSNSAISAIH